MIIVDKADSLSFCLSVQFLLFDTEFSGTFALIHNSPEKLAVKKNSDMPPGQENCFHFSKPKQNANINHFLCVPELTADDPLARLLWVNSQGKKKNDAAAALCLQVSYSVERNIIEADSLLQSPWRAPPRG